MATRPEGMDLPQRLKTLEKRIKRDGLGISQSTEKDILKIMAGKNLDDKPHMKFFWDQQMKLLHSIKMGRRYHPQIIRFVNFFLDENISVMQLFQLRLSVMIV